MKIEIEREWGVENGFGIWVGKGEIIIDLPYLRIYIMSNKLVKKMRL